MDSTLGQMRSVLEERRANGILLGKITELENQLSVVHTGYMTLGLQINDIRKELAGLKTRGDDLQGMLKEVIDHCFITYIIRGEQLEMCAYCGESMHTADCVIAGLELWLADYT